MSLARSPAELERIGLHASPMQSHAGASIASPTASSSRSFQSQHSSSATARSPTTPANGAVPVGRSPTSTRLRYRHWLKPLTPTPLDSDAENDEDDSLDTLMPSQLQQHESHEQQHFATGHRSKHDKELSPTERPQSVQQPLTTVPQTGSQLPRIPASASASASFPAPAYGLASASAPAKETHRPRFRRVELSSLDVIRPRIFTRLLYFYENNTHQHQHQGTTLKEKDKGKQKQGQPAEQSTDEPTENVYHKPSPASSPAVSPGRRNRQKSAVLHDQHHATHFMDPMLLQASLALVLSDFYPLAGRLVTDDGHRRDSLDASSSGSSKRPYIECNDQGVLFAVADCSFSLDQIRQGNFQDKSLPRHLHPVGLYPAALRNPPLLAIQVTYTQDGSLILGIAADSMVMDGSSLVSFMEAWSKTTRGKDYSHFPSLDRSLLVRPKDPSANATYRHHHVTHAPPPPIMFDNGLASVDPEAILDESSSETEDDEQHRHAEAMGEKQEEGDEKDEKDEKMQLLDDINGEKQDDAQEGDEKADKDEAEKIKDRPVAGNNQSFQSAATSSSKQPNSATPLTSETCQTLLHHQELLDNDREDVLEATHELEGAQLRMLHFTPRQLDQIKKLASEQNIAAAACAADDKEISDKWVSTGDALMAYLWKLTTISRRMEPECKMMCSILMDVRHRLQPRLAEGFIGNALLLIRDELLLQTPEQIDSAMTWIEQQEDPQLIETTSGNAFGQDFSVWSFRKLAFYSADFGQGPPHKVRIGRGGFGGGEGMCVMMDSGPPPLFFGGGGVTKGGTGAPPTGVDVYLGLQGEHLEDFEKVHDEFMASLVPQGAGSRGEGLSSPRSNPEGAEWEII
ncbi:hypothetical protein DFQ26_009279 [Actinomortierella ambigua]|nr:hypothetical protein DFQ26_009279 [Actinomortierella ambigua]